MPPKLTIFIFIAYAVIGTSAFAWSGKNPFVFIAVLVCAIPLGVYRARKDA